MKLKLRLPKRRLYRIAIYIISILIILLALDLLLVRLNRHLTISPDTTFITTPLSADGTPDYIHYLNEQQSQGITPENNAANILLSISPTMLADFSRDETYARLRMSPPPPDAARPTDYADFVHQRTHESLEKDEINAVLKTDWSPTPQRLAWLESNARALDILHAAAARPRYYIPYIPSSNYMFTSILVPALGPMRLLGEIAAAHAIYSAHIGNFDAARQDLLDIHRLARLLAQDPYLITRIVAYSIERTADQATIAIASGNLSSTQLQLLLTDLTALSPLPKPETTVERFGSLAIFSYASSHGFSQIFHYIGSSNSDPSNPEIFFADLIPRNVNASMRIINSYYNRLDAATNLPVYTDANAAGNALDLELEKNARQFTPFSSSSVLAYSIMPSLGRLPTLYHIHLTQIRLAQLALALAAFHADHKNYPQSLSALAPAYFKEIPQDPFLNQPFLYIPTPTGYTLHSFDPDAHPYDPSALNLKRLINNSLFISIPLITP